MRGDLSQHGHGHTHTHTHLSRNGDLGSVCDVVVFPLLFRNRQITDLMQCHSEMANLACSDRYISRRTALPPLVVVRLIVLSSFSLASALRFLWLSFSS